MIEPGGDTELKDAEGHEGDGSIKQLQSSERKGRWQSTDELIAKAHKFHDEVHKLMQEGLSMGGACRKIGARESITLQGVVNLVSAYEEMQKDELVNVLAKKGFLKFFSILEIKKAKVEYGIATEDVIRKAMEMTGRTGTPQDVSTAFTVKEITDAITAVTNRPERAIIPRKKKNIVAKDESTSESLSAPPTAPSRELKRFQSTPFYKWKVPGGKNSEETVKALGTIKQGVVKILGTLILAEKDSSELEGIIRERVIDMSDEIRSKIARILETIKERKPELVDGLELEDSQDSQYEKLQEFMERFRAKMNGTKRSNDSILTELATEDGCTTQNYRNYFAAATFMEEHPVLARLMRIRKIKMAAVLELRNIYKVHNVDPLKVLTAIVRERDVKAIGRPRQKYEIMDIINLTEDVFAAGDISGATNQLIGESKIEIPNIEIDSDPEKGAMFIKYGLEQLVDAMKKGEYNEEVVNILNYTKQLLSELIRMTHDGQFPMEIPEDKPSFTEYIEEHNEKITHNSAKVIAAIKRLAQVADEHHGIVFFDEKEIGETEIKTIERILDEIGLVAQKYELTKKSLKTKGRAYTKQTGYRMEWKGNKPKVKRVRRKITLTEENPSQQQPVPQPAPKSAPPPSPAPRPSQKPAPRPQPVPIEEETDPEVLARYISKPPEEKSQAPVRVSVPAAPIRRPVNLVAALASKAEAEEHQGDFYEYEVTFSIGAHVIDIATEEKFFKTVAALKAKLEAAPNTEDIVPLKDVIGAIEEEKAEIPAIQPWQQKLPKIIEALRELIKMIETKTKPAEAPKAPEIPLPPPPPEKPKPVELYADHNVYTARPETRIYDKLRRDRLRIVTRHHPAHEEYKYVPEYQVIVIRESDIGRRNVEGFIVNKRDLIMVGGPDFSPARQAPSLRQQQPLRQSEPQRGPIYRDDRVYKISPASTSSKSLTAYRIKVITRNHPRIASAGIVRDGEVHVALLDSSGKEVGVGTLRESDLILVEDDPKRVPVQKIGDRVSTPTPSDTRPSSQSQRPSSPQPSFDRRDKPQYRGHQQYTGGKLHGGHQGAYGNPSHGSHDHGKHNPPEERTEPWLAKLTKEFTTDEGRTLEEGTPIQVIPKTTDEYRLWLLESLLPGIGKKSFLVRVGMSKSDYEVIPKHIVEAM